MKLVQTLVVRDEADIVDAQIAYHLNAGVDFVIASDHESQRRHDRDPGVVRARRPSCVGSPCAATMRDGPVAHPHGPARSDRARRGLGDQHRRRRVLDAARRNAQGGLRGRARAHWGVSARLSRHFVPRPDERRLFRGAHDGACARRAAAINDPTSPYRPHLKAAHRADPEITDQLRLAHGVERPVARHASTGTPRTSSTSRSDHSSSGRTRAYGGRAATSPSASTSRLFGRARAAGAPIVSARWSWTARPSSVAARPAGSSPTIEVRDALRALRGIGEESRAVPVDEGRLSESTAVQDADLVRLQRFFDGLASTTRETNPRTATAVSITIGSSALMPYN